MAVMQVSPRDSCAACTRLAQESPEHRQAVRLQRRLVRHDLGQTHAGRNRFPGAGRMQAERLAAGVIGVRRLGRLARETVPLLPRFHRLVPVAQIQNLHARRRVRFVRLLR